MKSLLPALFVLLWSTGFISAKFGLPYAGPLTYLLARFALVFVLMLPFALLTRATWPLRPIDYAHVCVAGLLVHGIYLGGVFVAIARGMPAGTAAMLVGLQPIVTVFLARGWLGERTTLRQWGGLGLGLLGVYFVVEHKIRFAGIDTLAMTAVLIALLAISIGTLYQKKFAANVDLRAGAVIQFGACAAVFAALTRQFEPPSIEWTWQFVVALAWSVLVLSVGATSLLYWLLRRGAAADVARLFYMVPAVTMLMAFAIFGEPITWLATLGLVLIAAGVVLARARAADARRP